MAHQVLTNLAASITDLKKHPMQTVKSAHGEPLAILSHNEPVFYCVPAPVFEAMMEALDDIELKNIIAMRAGEKEIEVNIHDL